MKPENNTDNTAGSDCPAAPCSPFFVFDVESIGLHGQAFAVAGGVYDRDGNTLHEFAYHCRPDRADGEFLDREWVAANVTTCDQSIPCVYPQGVRAQFWGEWLAAKENWPGITMAVECGWPVEARFLNACIGDDRGERNWSGPYPMHEIASIMLAAGMDPMATYERLPNEMPAHEPLADARQSARLLATALKSLVNDIGHPRRGGKPEIKEGRCPPLDEPACSASGDTEGIATLLAFPHDRPGMNLRNKTDFSVSDISRHPNIIRVTAVIDPSNIVINDRFTISPPRLRFEHLSDHRLELRREATLWTTMPDLQ